MEIPWAIGGSKDRVATAAGPGASSVGGIPSAGGNATATTGYVSR